MRTRFIGKEINKGDAYSLIWIWKTQIIDFDVISKERLSENGNRFPNPTKIEYLFERVGVPDKEEHTWRNGEYSSEYNEALNYGLDLDLIEIICDGYDEESVMSNLY